MISHACPTCRREYKRSDEQSAKFHAICNDVSKVKKWAGCTLDAESWKRLFVAAWMRSTDRNIEIYPSLDGHGFDAIYRRTSRLGKSEMSELIEYVSAWCANNDVNLEK